MTLKILVVGLDNSGKSSAILKLTGSSRKPSNGWSFEPRHLTYKVKEAAKVLCLPFQYTKQYQLVFWDIGGSPNFRNIWPNYFANVHGVIYFVDASDISRLQESASTLAAVYLDARVVGKPLLM
jgi:GTPase SAR1 family protein